jgi:hypothetical protein
MTKTCLSRGATRAAAITSAKVPSAKVIRLVERARHHLSRLHQRTAPPEAVMMELLTAACVSQGISVAADLGLADALAQGPLPIDELAARVGADADALHRLLRALISRGIFRRRRDGRYELNPLADTLRSDAPASTAGMARLMGSRQDREHWSLLLDAIRTGTAVIPRLRGTDFFAYLRDEPELGEIFNQAMTSGTTVDAAAVVAAHDFTAYPTIVDVGGGHGRLLAAILSAAPAARGVLYDTPQVVAGAPALLREHNVADRVHIAQGSFFDSIPKGGDAYVLKNIIHDWPDDKAVQILQNVRAAAAVGTTVLLIETVLPEHNREFSGNWMDLGMLLIQDGRERTAAEYRHLFEQAGFRMTQVVHTTSSLSLVKARAA